MIEERKLVASSIDGTILANPYIRHQVPSDTLAVFFPGLGYTSERPLLYYGREVALQAGLDTLSLQCSFQAGSPPRWEKHVGGLLTDARAAIDACTERAYARYVFVGKSVGTILAGRLAQSMEAPVRHVLMTPVVRTLDALPDTPSLAIAGSADARFTASLALGLKSHPLMDLHILEGVGHSLEIRDDYRGSLHMLETVCGLLDSFFRSL